MKIIKGFFVDGIFLVIGSAAYAFGFSVFLEPLGISPGGITGVAAIISFVSGLPAGSLVFFLNLPLIIVGFFKLGKRLIIKTFVSTFLSSVFIDLFALILPITSDRIIAALAAGVFIGAGMAMIFLRGGTSGGTDIAAKLLKLKNPYISIGRLLLIMDGVIISLSAFVYGSFESALYSVLFILVSTYLIDKTLSETGGKVAFIITDAPEAVKKGIYMEIGRGVSEISALGGYSGKGKTLLICALGRRQSADFRRMIKQHDSEAFSIILDASEIIGSGFSVY